MASHRMEVETLFKEKNVEIYDEDIALFGSVGIDVLRADERDRFYVVRAVPMRGRERPRVVLLAQLAKVDAARSDLLLYKVVLKDLAAALVALDHTWRDAYIPGTVWHACESHDTYSEFVERANWAPRDRNRSVTLLLL